MKSIPYFQSKRAEAQAWARHLLALPADQWAVLDTETTGLHSADQIVQISVIDGAGDVLISNQLIKPTVPISGEAQAIHGISIDQLIDAPTFAEFAPQLDEVLRNRIVVIYNASFDARILRQSRMAGGQDTSNFSAECAMIRYAEWVGEWNEKRGNFRWQKLEGGDHSSLGDCLATYELIKKMAL